MISIYNKIPEIECSPRRIELFDQYYRLIAIGRKNPVKYLEIVYGIRLLDFQKYAIMSAWTTNVSVLLMSRNSGKSLLAAIYLFLRCTLFPKQQCYIIASSSAQANETFDKLHKLCTGGIKTMSYRWELMALEIKKSQGSDGFNNFGEGKKCEFNNGSQVFSLPGNPDTIRGKRADLVIYDEASFISNEMFRSTKAFTAQDSNFKTAKKDVDISVHPLLLPKQQIFLSSAGNVDSEMYRQYSYCTRQMLAGSKEYFVCDFDYQIPANPTLDGKEYPPLLDQKTIDSERANAYNFEHEFMNLFVETGTDDAVVSRDVIMRNEIEYKPTLYSENEKNVIYGIFHDSARSQDNSIVLIVKYWNDEEVGWKGRLVNCVNLLDYSLGSDKKKKVIMTTDKQIEWIRKFMIAYNGNAPEWEAIHVFEDPGGLGMSIADFLVKDWEDEDGIMHKGVIDMTYENSAVTRQINPGAKEGVLQLLNARKYKELMYEATMDLLPRNLIEFPAPLHSNHKLQIDGKVIYLSKEEVRALTELDMLKNEICTMRKKQNKVGYSYELEPTMRNRMHDDRAYVLAAACYYLAQLRHEEELKYARPALDMSVLYKNKGKGGFCSGGGDGLDKPAYQNPFLSRKNPFQNR